MFTSDSQLLANIIQGQKQRDPRGSPRWGKQSSLLVSGPARMGGEPGFQLRVRQSAETYPGCFVWTFRVKWGECINMWIPKLTQTSIRDRRWDPRSYSFHTHPFSHKATAKLPHNSRDHISGSFVPYFHQPNYLATKNHSQGTKVRGEWTKSCWGGRGTECPQCSFLSQSCVKITQAADNPGCLVWHASRYLLWQIMYPMGCLFGPNRIIYILWKGECQRVEIEA